jgi:hypothetical protein
MRRAALSTVSSGTLLMDLQPDYSPENPLRGFVGRIVETRVSIRR